jgi:hypothetical protein
MANLTIRVPGEHVDDVRDALLDAYSAVAEALHLSAVRHLTDRAHADELLGHRTELLDLDDALMQVGVDPGPAAGPVEVTAHPEVLADALVGAAQAILERLEPAVERFGRAGQGREAVAAERRALDAVLVLLDEVL